MRKLFSALTTTLLLAAVFSFLVVQPVAALDCGDGNTHGRCNDAGGCPSGGLCIDGPWMNDAYCEKDPAKIGARCDNTDYSREYVCGVNYFTDQWCGVSGGCAHGYMCNSTTLTCEKSAGCEFASDTFRSQCGMGSSVNQCGNSGNCQHGYRCIKVTTTTSRDGYACVNQKDVNTGQYCPGAPGQPVPPTELLCGQVTTDTTATCSCTATNPDGKPKEMSAGSSLCCGFAVNNVCWQSVEQYAANNPDNPPPVNPNLPNNPNNPLPPNNSVPEANTNLNIFSGPNSKDFETLNPLKSQGTESVNAAYFTSPAGIISRVLLFAFPIAGLILFIMLVWAGFQILMGAFQGGSKAIDAGKQRATTALIGFLLLFVSYWIMQIIETIFSITIL